MTSIVPYHIVALVVYRETNSKFILSADCVNGKTYIISSHSDLETAAAARKSLYDDILLCHAQIRSPMV